MTFEKCPKCGRMLVELNPRMKRVECYNPKCDYKKAVDVDEYHRKHNVLPKLMKIVEQNERLYGVANPPVHLLKYLRVDS